jgi:hypothetical protein
MIRRLSLEVSDVVSSVGSGFEERMQLICWAMNWIRIWGEPLFSSSICGERMKRMREERGVLDEEVRTGRNTNELKRSV